MEKPYESDLAYIHDVGYGDVAQNAAAYLRDFLQEHGKTDGLVVELGCGSGISAEVLVTAGYDVLGYDISEEMIALARRRVPRAEFRTQSFLDAKLPSCVAVTAIGECFSYLFDARNTMLTLASVFRRISRALEPTGLLLFDVAEPGRTIGSDPHYAWREGDGWAVGVEAREDDENTSLTRRITSFRRVGELFRRHHEVHRLRLYDRRTIRELVRSSSLTVRALGGYWPLQFPRGQVGFLARKPR